MRCLLCPTRPVIPTRTPIPVQSDSPVVCSVYTFTTSSELFCNSLFETKLYHVISSFNKLLSSQNQRKGELNCGKEIKRKSTIYNFIIWL